MTGGNWQKTLSAPALFKGVGLHSGKSVELTVSPAPGDAGIVFLRRDLMNGDARKNRAAKILANPDNVIRADHGTTIANGQGAYVSTVEHLMAALALCGVDNAVIDLVGPEVPILDGSASAFVAGICAKGLKTLPETRRDIDIDHPISVVEGDRFISIEPAAARKLSVTIDFPDCFIGRQSIVLDLEDPGFIDRIASARTFCRLDEVETLRQMGLIRGGSMDNAIVVDGERILNDQPLRDEREFALHKALDLIGDLYLLGAPIRGAIRAHKPGHDLNTRAALAVARAAAGVREPMAAAEHAVVA
ncbi:MAG: UDP-3-O-acyl-N-acetylglucosamine deacetylase [Pseudomonadota bacterium]